MAARHRFGPRTCHAATAIALAIALSCGLETCDAEPVVVALRDGRIVRGAPDPATSHEWLWIHRTAPGVLLRSGFAWSDVAEVWLGEEQMSAAELRQRLTAMPLAAPPAPPPANAPLLLPAAAIEPQFPGRIESLQVAAAP